MWRDVRASLPEDTRNCLDAGGVFLR
jgi:hypothetical protein